jgi:hypothetical protein
MNGIVNYSINAPLRQAAACGLFVPGAFLFMAPQKFFIEKNNDVP